jgi:prepilin signal peptidase PulO-like enzyme (type II secretory pathway)
MLGLIAGLIGVFVAIITGIGGALLGLVTALGGVLLGLAVPFAPLLIVAGLVIFLISGQKHVHQIPQNHSRR